MEQNADKIESRGAKILPAVGFIIDLYLFYDARNLKVKNQER